MVSAWDEREYIPCQYDSIFSVYDAPYNIKDLFVAVKDGKMYAWTYRGKPLFDGKAITSLTSVKKKDAQLHNSDIGGGAIFLKRPPVTATCSSAKI